MSVQFMPRIVRQEVTAARADDYAAATNAAAVVTYPAIPGVAHAITEGVAYSYGGSGTLAGGNLTITSDGVTVFSVDIPAKQCGFFPFRKYSPLNTALVITLADGSANVDGKVTVLGHAVFSGSPVDGQGQLDFSDYIMSGHI